MIRRQIQLTEEQYRQLKRWAARQRISFAAAVRRCIAERLSSAERAADRKAFIRDALSVLGAYEDPEGLSNVAVDHDRHLSEAARR